MQNLFGILNSQSRYELQTKFLFNPNGLVVDENNRFGDVDNNGKISIFRNSVNEIDDFDRLNQITLSLQPSLIENAFGVKKGIESINSGTSLRALDVDSFKPDSFDEFWVALKLKPNVSGGVLRNIPFYFGELSLSSGYAFFFFNQANNSFVVDLRTGNTGTNPLNRKVVTIPTTVNGSNEFNLICHISGTDDANDWKIYESGILATKTVAFNDSFVGSTLYPGNNDYSIQLCSNLSPTVNYYKGLIGKIMGGYGSPNVLAVNESLN